MTKTLYFSKASSFNDPFDSQLLPEEFERNLELMGCHIESRKLLGLNDSIKDRIDGYGILSLSKVDDSIMMWSHYADSHKGICLGFNNDLYRHLRDVDWPIDTKEITYQVEHPFSEIYRDIYSGQRFNSNDNFANLCKISTALLDNAFTVKHIDWGYEKEVRMISDVATSISFNPEALEEVTVGMNTSVQDEELIRSILSEQCWNHVRLRRGKKGTASLSLEFDQIERKQDVGFKTWGDGRY